MVKARDIKIIRTVAIIFEVLLASIVLLFSVLVITNPGKYHSKYNSFKRGLNVIYDDMNELEKGSMVWLKKPKEKVLNENSIIVITSYDENGFYLSYHKCFGYVYFDHETNELINVFFAKENDDKASLEDVINSLKYEFRGYIILSLQNYGEIEVVDSYYATVGKFKVNGLGSFVYLLQKPVNFLLYLILPFALCTIANMSVLIILNPEKEKLREEIQH